MTTLGELLQTAIELHNCGKLAEAERIYWAIQEQVPNEPNSLHLLGLIAHQVGKNQAGLDMIDQAIAVDGNQALFHQHRGVVLGALGRRDDACKAFERALVLAPESADSHSNFANLLMEAGRLNEALEHLDIAVRLAPDNYLFRHNRGYTLEKLGQLDEALAEYRHSRSLNPKFVEGWNGEGEILRRTGYLERAIEAYQTALAINPKAPDVLNNLALAFKSKGLVFEAQAMLERCLNIAPEHSPAWNNIGNVLQTLGRMEQAAEAFGRSVAIDRRQHVAHSNLIFVSSYMETSDGDKVREEASRWDGRQSQYLPAGFMSNQARVVDPAPDRRLRVGFVSADFRDHAVSYFLLPLFKTVDPSRIELFLYSEAMVPDTMTERFRELVPHWRVTRGLPDSVLAETIRADAVDILVDCSGHTAGGRLPAFLLRPAPVQVTTLLGHGGTSGCGALDYIISDPVITPPALDRHFSEKVVRTQGFFAPFAPRDDWPSGSESVPRDLVFACVGEPIRIGHRTVELWRRLLDRVPGSRLILKNKAYTQPALQRHWRNFFAPLGERVTLEGVPDGWGGSMDFYDNVRVVLDTYPATGATSSAIPLWMGVPVMTLTGSHSVQRFGASVVTHVGLPDLAPESEEEYLDRAARLIEDQGRLADLRRNLRSRMRATICDAPAITRDWELMFRKMWHERVTKG